jgi:hypothetical protein
MKVSELIKQLQDIPQDVDIHFWGYHDSVCDIHDVVFCKYMENDFGTVSRDVWIMRDPDYVMFYKDEE